MHLARVRAGEEVLVRDRQAPIAKLVPSTGTEDASADEAALAAEGKVRLPRTRLAPSFWTAAAPRLTTDRALEILREDREAR